MKNFSKTVFILLAFITCVSCSKWLDVQPDDEFLEDQVYQSESGINNVLNDLYLDMAKPNLYGGQLTMSTVDVLGQRYNLSDSRHTWFETSHYLYDESGVKDKFNAIWKSAYKVILGANKLMENLDKYNALTAEKENIIKGEAYGIRAMIHFDLLRLFGPVYKNNPDARSIPYYTEAKTEVQPLLPASEVLKNILNDLKQAEDLLKEDPIISNGVEGDPEDPFYTHRNYRINFYAVKALEARVYLYAGKTQEAYEAAREVIDKASGFFPWTDPTKVISDNANPDRVFSSEVIFGIQNIDLYDQYKALFAPELQDLSILAPNSSLLENTFEGNQNDYRYNSTWIIPTTGEKTYRTFFKFADVVDKEEGFRFLQPLIRISEMYYIVAETSPAENEALEALNTVRHNRGLINLTSTDNLEGEIEKEYQKEFYGEGQLFFYYKRKALSTIPDGSAQTPSQTLSMGEAEYVVPLPDSELQFQQ